MSSEGFCVRVDTPNPILGVFFVASYDAFHLQHPI